MHKELGQRVGVGLRPFREGQHKAMKYCRSVAHPFLAMKMRCGKTLVAIRHSDQRVGLGGRKLVIAPTTSLTAWRRELRLEGGPWTELGGSREERTRALVEGWGKGGWFLVNKEALLVFPELVEAPWDAVILDESTFIKNPQAKITQLLIKNFRRVKLRMCLSANPAPESSLDWFCQMQFLSGTFLNCKNYWDFRATFFQCVGYDWVPRKGSFDRIAFALKQRVFFMTTKEAGLANEHIRETRYVDMDPKLWKEYRKMEDVFEAEIDGTAIATNFKTVQAVYLHRMAQGYGGKYLFKHKDLVHLLTNELGTEQVVVWFRYTADIETAASLLQKKGTNCAILNGKTPPKQRDRIDALFRDNKIRVLLVQLKVGRFSLDFSTADTQIYFTNDHSAETREHSQARLESAAKSGVKAILTIDMVTRNTTDEDALYALQDKTASSKVFFSRMYDSFIQRRASGQEV